MSKEDISLILITLAYMRVDVDDKVKLNIDILDSKLRKQLEEL